MDKYTFCKRVGIWTAVIASVILAFIGLCFGKQIETTLFGEVSKWIVMGFGIIILLECFVYFLAPLYWHFYIEGKDENKK